MCIWPGLIMVLALATMAPLREERYSCHQSYNCFSKRSLLSLWEQLPSTFHRRALKYISAYGTVVNIHWQLIGRKRIHCLDQGHQNMAISYISYTLNGFATNYIEGLSSQRYILGRSLTSLNEALLVILRFLPVNYGWMDWMDLPSELPNCAAVPLNHHSGESHNTFFIQKRFFLMKVGHCDTFFLSRFLVICLFILWSWDAFITCGFLLFFFGVFLQSTISFC